MPEDPLAPRERDALMRQPRPRRDLPLVAQGAKKRLPLLPTRGEDATYRPVYAVWEITLACDLSCRHCGSRAGRARPDELTTAECFQLVDQLAELGCREVILIGGEAYLRDDCWDVVRHIRARGMQPLITTGGRNLGPARAQAAKDAGIASVSVSIDGLEATHDRLRAVAGSHRAALEALRHLRDAGVRISANTQINRLSAPELPEILELLIAHGVHSWQIQLTVPMGRAADEPDVLLQPYDLLDLFPMLGQLQDRCRDARVMLWPGNNIGYFGPFETLLRGRNARGHGGSCGAGRATLGIEANGAIKGCPSLPSDAWTGGNIRDDKLADIWERSAPLRYTRDRTTDDLWGFCQTCYYAEECMSGCTWTSFVTFGKPGNNPYCHHRALEMQRAGKRERIVKVDEAPGQPFDHGVFRIEVEDV